MPRIPLTPAERDNSVTFRINTQLKNNIEKIAVMNRTTVTDIFNDLAGQFAGEHRKEIQYYDNVFAGKIGGENADR